MIPLTLHLTDFLSYRSMEEPLDLTGVHVACLSGPNGAGKSALLDAITWALWGKARGSEGGQEQDRLIRDGAETARVEITFELDGELYRVAHRRSRGGKPDLWFNVRAPDGSWTDLSGEGIRDTDRRIVERLRMDYETFVMSAFVLQGRADTFTRLGPAERKEVLGRILGIEIYERLADRAREYKREATGRADALRGDAERFAAEAAELPLVAARLEEADRAASTAEEAERAATKQQDRAREQLAELRAAKEAAEELGRREESIAALLLGITTEIEGLAKEIDDLKSVTQPDDAIVALAGERPLLEERERHAEEERVRDDGLGREAADLERRIAVDRARLETEAANAAGAVAAAEEEGAKAGAAQAALAEGRKALAALDGDAQEHERLRERHRALREEIVRLDAENEERERRRTEVASHRELLAGAEAECPLCASSLTDEHRDRLAEEAHAALSELAKAGRTATSRRRLLEKEIAEVESAGRDVAARLASRDVLAGRVAALEATLTHIADSVAAAGHLRERVADIRKMFEGNSDSPTERAKLQDVVRERTALGYAPDLHALLRSRLAAAREAERSASEAARVRDRLESVLARREGAERRRRDAEQEHAEIRARAQELQARLGGLSDAEQALGAASRVAEEARSALVAARTEGTALRERVAVLRRLAEDAGRARKEHRVARKLAGLYDRLARIFGRDGIPARIVGNAIPELREEANRLLGLLSDGRLSISIDPVKETKAKTRRDTLDVTVYDLNGGKRAYEMYSGGERLRIDFALRIALSRLLARRANTRLETLVIDEGFGSQDAEGRARLVEAILRVRGDFRRILVITHIDDLKDQFPQRIEVTKDPARGSRAALV